MVTPVVFAARRQVALPGGLGRIEYECSRPIHSLNQGGDPLSSPSGLRNLVWASDRLIGS